MATRYLIIPALALGVLLASCSSSHRITPAETALTGCDAFASALMTLASLNSAGKLSESKVELVDKTKAYVDPFCTGPAPAVDVSAINLTVTAGVSVLQSIILGD